MSRYLVNSEILRLGTDPRACAEGAAKMLSSGKIKDVEAQACFCCTDEKRVAFIVEAPSRDSVLQTLQEQLDIPIASINEVEEVTANK